jgi:hypothetical protein
MYGSTTTTTMYDDGFHNDGAAGDGIYGASIPASASDPGEMVRYYATATDVLAQSSRYPFFNNPVDTQYEGTVIADPGVSSQLPIYHWFVPDDDWFVNGDGSHNYNVSTASLYYDGEFYDNITVNVKGLNSGQYSWPKFEFSFHSGKEFIYTFDGVEQESVKKFDMASVIQDPSASRLTVGYEMFREAGAPASIAYPVHSRMNGDFYRISIHIERILKPFLERNGLDREGSVYKADGVYDYTGQWLQPGADIGTTNGMMKTNREEYEPSFSDLQDLISGVAPWNSSRQQYLLDNVDLPSFFNTLAMYTITKNFDSATHNYYVYRDSDGDGLWRMMPWDLDLIWEVYETVYDIDFSGHPFLGSSSVPSWGNDHWNKLIDAVVDSPLTQELYLRRLRTLMDQFLQPPGTPLGNRVLENRVAELTSTLAAEWGVPPGGFVFTLSPISSLSAGINHLRDGFDERRSYLYSLGIIPSAQPTVSNLTIGDFDSNPSSGDQGEEYIEIVNPNNFAVDISGWSLTSAVDHTFYPGTVVPSQGSLYVVRNLDDFQNRTTGPSTGQGLVIQGDYSGGLSTAGELLELRNDVGAVIDTEDIPAASADFDSDGEVSGYDFLAWQLGYGTQAPAATLADGDADFDENVDGTDLTVWEAQYGTSAPISAIASSFETSPAYLASDLVNVAIVWSNSSEAVSENSPESMAAPDETFATFEGSEGSPLSLAQLEANREIELSLPDVPLRASGIAEELIVSLGEDGILEEF